MYGGKTCPARSSVETALNPRLVRMYLTECIYQLVLESQLPHKIVNMLFTITYQMIKLTVLWGS